MPAKAIEALKVNMALVRRKVADPDKKGSVDKLTYQAIGENTGIGTLYIDASKIGNATPPEMVTLTVAAIQA